ncbi:type II toxin-antitoxin system RelE family toxin [Alsobacter sp. SYSU BS001988]
MLKIALSGEARRQLRGLPEHVQVAVRDKLERYAATGAGDVKAMSGLPGLRLRCGDYRILFDKAGGQIRVRAIAHRSKIYS